VSLIQNSVRDLWRFRWSNLWDKWIKNETTYCPLDHNCLLAKYRVSISLNLISMVTKSKTNILSVNLFPQCLHIRTGSRHITVLHSNTFKYFTCSHPIPYQRFEVFTVVKIQVEVFWAVTPCSVVARFRHFGCVFRLHLHPEDGGVSM
jgi:hypothetical protein